MGAVDEFHAGEFLSLKVHLSHTELGLNRRDQVELVRRGLSGKSEPVSPEQRR